MIRTYTATDGTIYSYIEIYNEGGVSLKYYHCEIGPAVITPDKKTKLYYLNGRILDKKVWERLVKMKAFW